MPVVRTHTDNSAGTKSFDDEISLKTDLDAAAAERHLARCLADLEDRTSEAICPGRTRHAYASACFPQHRFIMAGVSCLKSAYSESFMPPNKVAVTVALPNLPYSTASTQAGIQRLRIKALCTSI